jgi:uncharacterized membrane protein YgcG
MGASGALPIFLNTFYSVCDDCGDPNCQTVVFVMVVMVMVPMVVIMVVAIKFQSSLLNHFNKCHKGAWKSGGGDNSSGDCDDCGGVGGGDGN